MTGECQPERHRFRQREAAPSLRHGDNLDVGLSITVSDWFYRSVLDDRALLTIDPAYFSITGGRERWLYRIVHKQAVACVAALAAGPMRPRDLKPIAPDAGKIHRRNVYGWFERIEPGLYRLAAAGATALITGAHAGEVGAPASASKGG